MDSFKERFIVDEKGNRIEVILDTYERVIEGIRALVEDPRPLVA
jgi:hypothetical protein